MTLTRRSGIALWRQVQIDLERQITDGTLQPGDQLPTEARLSAQFGVNRHTVRRALAGMEDRGLIRVEQGRGTFVQEPVLEYRVSLRTRFTDNIMREKRVPTRTLVEAGITPASAQSAAALDLAPGTPLLRVVMSGESDGRRISHSEHLFPADRFPNLEEAVRETGSITQALRRAGVDDYRRKWTRISARIPSGREAEALQQPRTRPVLVTESLNVDPDGRPLEHGTTLFNSDWVEVVFEP